MKMAGFSVTFFCLLFFGYQQTAAQNVTFDTQVTLTAVDPDAIGQADRDNVEDPIGCGSYLFKATGAELTKAISLNILISHFKSADSVYFRVHPTLIKCIQQAMTKLRNEGTQVVVKSGFKTANDIGSSTDDVDLYQRSGCGIELEFKPGVSGNLDDIAKAVLKTCPVPMMKIQRDIGIKKLSNSVHIHMKGENYTGGPTFENLQSDTVLYQYIGEGIDPQSTPDCSSIQKITSGNTFPSGKSDPVTVVGEVDEAIYRNMTDDYNRLIQYLGENIQFDACNRYVGNSNSERCNERTMTTRMYNVIRVLQKLVRDQMTDTLKITEGFDDTGANPTLLHSEGRAVKVQLLTNNNAANVETLAQLAVCSGADFVKNEGMSLIIAVKKMKGDSPTFINFKGVQMISVEPPTSKAWLYNLPDLFSQTEIDTKYVLFDSSGRESLKLNDNATVGMFKSQDAEVRYFRIDPRIVRCYSAIVYSTNKNLEDGSEAVEIEVEHGYLSNQENGVYFDTSDERNGPHTYGVAMQIKYKNGTGSEYTPQTLARKAVEQCSPIFDGDDQEHTGIGIYQDSVYVDIRDTFELWLENDNLLPTAFSSVDNYVDYMAERALLAKKFRIVDPDDLTEACALAHPPAKQSTSYAYVEPEISKRKKRRKRATVDTCVPRYDTTHCSQTAQYLQAEVDEIWTQIDRKYFHNKTGLNEALHNCFGICGTCLEGSIYEQKLEHCNNLLHWMPFDLMNENTDITNFYSRDNLDSRSHACNGGKHCLEKAPLFSILAPSLKRTYRSDPTKGVEDAIYATEENPNPSLQILDEIYAMTATGIIHFWVKDETDITSMEKPLQVVMLYNKAVTKIMVYVKKPEAISSVQAKLEGYSAKFATTGCPKYSRETITEFEVTEFPHSVTKRAASPKHAMKNQLVMEQMNWEARSIRGP